MTAEQHTQTPDITPQASFLVADCGTIHTTATLFDIAAGSYRLIARGKARTTAFSPWNDLMEGLRQAIRQITEITGRTLLNEKGILIRPTRPNGSGVDHFLLTVSAAPPLRTLLVGLSEDVSLVSARHALKTIYAEEIDTFSLTDGRSETRQIAALVQTQPDLIFITGGTDHGANERLLQLVETIRLGLNILTNTKRPQVLYAGNIALREKVSELLSEHVSVQIAENIRPTLDTEQIHDASNVLREIYDDLKVNALPGIREAHEWSSHPIVPTVTAMTAITDYFARVHDGPVITVDLGSNSASLFTATPNYHETIVRSDLGLGRPAKNLLRETGVENIARWIPADVSLDEIRDFLYQKSQLPQTVPLSQTDLYVEQAVAREIIRCLLVDSQYYKAHRLTHVRQILACGSVLTNAPNPAQAVLMLLDALQPVGIFPIVLDKYGVLPALGAMAAHHPVAVVQALEGGALAHMGWVIAPMGSGQIGQKALAVDIVSEESDLQLEVEYGSIEIFPLGPGKTAEIHLTPTRGFDIGFGKGKSKKVTLYGGTVGIVIDARPRPLQFPTNEEERQSLVRQWRWYLGG